MVLIIDSTSLPASFYQSLSMGSLDFRYAQRFERRTNEHVSQAMLMRCFLQSYFGQPYPYWGFFCTGGPVPGYGPA